MHYHSKFIRRSLEILEKSKMAVLMKEEKLIMRMGKIEQRLMEIQAEL